MYDKLDGVAAGNSSEESVVDIRRKMMDRVAKKNKAEFDSFKCEKRSATRKSRGNGARMIGPVTGQVVSDFKKAMDLLIRPISGAKGLSNLQAEKVVRDSDAVIAFDRVYKPYVFEILKKNHGFRPSEDTDAQGNLIYRNGTLDMECIYHDVLLKLMSGAIDGFDMSCERVGKGAFRNYLKRTVASAFYEAKAPELIPVFKPDGTPEYTDQCVKDKSGKPKVDEHGEIIYKQRKEFRTSFEAEHVQNAIAQRGFGGAIGTREQTKWLSSEIVNLRLFFVKCAYLESVQRKKEKVGEGWRLKAMLDVFEAGKDEDEVRDELLRCGAIKKPDTYYVAKTVFLNDWKELAEKTERKVLKRCRLDSKSLPGALGKKSPFRKGVYEWHPIVDRDEAAGIVAERSREICDLVGVKRIREVNAMFARIMMMLVSEADRKQAARNAKRFAEVEKALKAETDERRKNDAAKKKMKAKS